MAVSKDQVRELLGCGLSNEVVATTVGCDPSYITQLMSDETFAGEVVALRAKTLTANNARDRNIDGIEDKLINKLEELVDSQQIYKPNDVLRAFSVINAAKRRGIPAHESTVINNTVVNLMIPTAVRQHFVINAVGEVVEIEGQSMETMTARNLLKNVSDKLGIKHGDQLNKIAGYITDETSNQKT